MIDLMKVGLKAQEICVIENDRKIRVAYRVTQQTARLAKQNKKLGYTQIPHPVWEETDKEYIKRINEMNLRVAIEPIMQIIAKEEAI